MTVFPSFNKPMPYLQKGNNLLFNTISVLLLIIPKTFKEHQEVKANKINEQRNPKNMNKILVPTDFSDCARAAEKCGLGKELMSISNITIMISL